jgi:5-methyltetrahydrofolate--homocysteine methyltransferase
MAQKRDLLEALQRTVIVCDGAMGTTLQQMNLTAADFGGRQGCNEALVLHRPDVIGRVHRGYLEVGVDMVETDTFGASRPKLDEYGLGEETHRLNAEAARIARKECDTFEQADGRPRFVAGSLGPSGFLPSSSDPDLGRVRPSALVEIFREQTLGLLEGGIDCVLAETAQDLLELRAQIHGARQAMEQAGRRVPILAQITLDPSGRMLLGTDPLAAAAVIAQAGADIMGLNCSTGPKEMVDPLRALADFAPLPLSCQPNAGIPENREGQAVYPLQPKELAEHLARFVRDFRVSLVGGCCGTTPEHLKEVIAAVRPLEAPRRPPARQPVLSSGLKQTSLHQKPPPLIIGERVNTQGSKKMKDLLLANDLSGVLGIAREQVEGGAHALDVCVALTERADENETMIKVVRLLSGQIEAPLCIDTTEAEVVASALEWTPGIAIVNSVHLERGWERIDKIFPLLKTYGAVTVAMTIDEQGMALTRERKLEVARRIYDRALQDGLQPWQLMFDVLTFTLATGEEQYRRSAIETIEGIALIKKELPGALTTLGVSNVSFGLSKTARPVINSVFLTHCLRAGLDAAIINPTHVLPWGQIPQEARDLAEDLVLARRDDALARLITHFEGAGSGPRQEAKAAAVHKTPEEKLHHLIVDRQQKELIETIDLCLKSRSAVQVINDILLGAMKEVGDRFGAGELILPFVLQSAEVMKKAVAYLEQFMEKNDSYSRGKIVLATVFGDVHDIGKNLVKTILANNGYTVVDLGKQVPVDKIVETAVAQKADAIGLSALLVSTSKQMPLVVKELDRRGLQIPVLIGGAAINRKFGWRNAYVEGGDKLYPGGVYYARDAFEGLDTVNALQDAQGKAKLFEKLQREAFVHRNLVAAGSENVPQTLVATTDVVPSPVGPPPRPRPPFWGTQVVDPHDLDLREIFDYLDLTELYRLQWGVKSKSREEYQRMIADEFGAKRRELQEECIRNGWLEPKVVYGYFPCSSKGNELFVHDPQDAEKPAAQRRVAWKFSFPRKLEEPRVCLADYFAEDDTVAFQIVTMGDRATALCHEWEQAGEFSKSYFLHGLAVESAEALAEYWHKRVRSELALDPKQGKRYSAGYPAWPDLADQKGVFELLGGHRIGVELTEAFQMVPEQSTSAVIVAHPQASYFSVVHGAGAWGTG